MRQEKKPGRAFASDNWAGVHPEVLAEMAVEVERHRTRLVPGKLQLDEVIKTN